MHTEKPLERHQSTGQEWIKMDALYALSNNCCLHLVSQSYMQHVAHVSVSVSEQIVGVSMFGQHVIEC